MSAACLQRLFEEASKCMPFPAAQPFLFYPYRCALRQLPCLLLPHLLSG